MLIQFSVGNFLSFKELVSLSMVSSAIKEHSDTHLFQVNQDIRLLKTAAIYGSNASGKSNLFKAMSFMSNFVANSSKDSQAEEEIDVDRFILSTKTTDQPSTFEIVFIQDNVTYRYGFQVDNVEVHNEWLFYAPKKQEVLLFERKGTHFVSSNSFKEGKDLAIKTRENALFLSVVAQFNGDISRKVLKWFKNFNVISGLQDKYVHISARLLEDKQQKELFLRLIKAVDLGIEDIELEKHALSVEGLPKEFQLAIDSLVKDKDVKFDGAQVTDIIMLHKKFDHDRRFIGFEKFDINERESQGTVKLFSILGPVLDTLMVGKVLVIDELDSRLHPLITSFIIGLFNSDKLNPHNAQLIFNTHDTNLLNRRVFRRDQIWFTEKDRYGSSDLYSLVEYKVRNDASYEKDYLLGKYGSIPFLGQFEWFSDSDGK